MRNYKVTFQSTGEADVTVEATSMENGIAIARAYIATYAPSDWPVQDVQVVKAEEVW